MNKTEIYEMAMQEMIEENLRLRRKSCTEQEKIIKAWQRFLACVSFAVLQLLAL